MTFQGLKFVIIIFVVFSVIMLGLAQFVRPIFAEHFDGLSNVSRAQALGVYAVTASAAIAFAVPVAGLVMSAAGFLFGPFYGPIAGVFCMVAGSFMTFVFTRKYLRNRISKKYEAEIQRVNSGMQRHGLKYLLFLRISPFPPVSVTNFAMGVTTVSCFNFLWISVVGLIPAAVIYAYIGSHLASLAQFN